MAGGLDDVGAHEQVVEVEAGRLGLVEADATDPGGEMHHQFGSLGGEERIGGAGPREVVVGAARRDDRGAALGELAHDDAPEEPRPPGDEHPPTGEVTSQVTGPVGGRCRTAPGSVGRVGRGGRARTHGRRSYRRWSRRRGRGVARASRACNDGNSCAWP